MAEKKITFDQTFHVLRPSIEPALPVPISLWNRYMNRIDKCSESSNFFESLGWACIGFGLSAILVAVTFPFSVEFVKVVETAERLNTVAVITEAICAAGGIAAIAIGIVSLVYAKSHRQHKKELADIIVEDMRAFSESHLEAKHPMLRQAPA